MITAMQEAIKLVKEYNNRKIPYNVLLGNLELLLEKEKEQIIKSHIDGFDYIVAEFKKQEYAEEYFNKTYKNQTP
jgi:hypothetical protein